MREPTKWNARHVDRMSTSKTLKILHYEAQFVSILEYIISGGPLNVISMKQTIIPGLTKSPPGQNGEELL